VKQFRADEFLRKRYFVAALAGFMMAASFEKIGVAGFAWIAPGVMLAAALGSGGGESFRVGYVAGFVHYLVALYWLLWIPFRWHGIPIGPAAGWLALAAFLALFPGTWVWLMTKVQNPQSFHQNISKVEETNSQKGKEEASETPKNPPPYVGGYTGAPDASSWGTRTIWSLSGAVAWIGMEMFIARVFTGFPWDLLGVSQYKLIPLIQIASVTGIYGISFIVVWTSLSLVAAAMTILRQPAARSAWVPDIILPALAVLLLFVSGSRRVNDPANAASRAAASPSRPEIIRVSFIQPSIPQTFIWDETKNEERFTQLLKLSEQAVTNKTDLLVWPEGAVPKLFRWYKDMFEPVAGLARSNHVWMIIGADDMEPKPGSDKAEDADYFNSSFLISPEGELRETYRKRGLVIFGEYVPLAHWLPFMKYLTPAQGSFTPGQSAVPFELSNVHVNTAVLICFEDIFPHLAREYVKQDTDFLVNITNNGWFDDSAAQWQHATTAIFRAIENGLPLLRCSNNGLTCWVDQFGRLREIFHDSKGGVYGRGFMTAEIDLRHSRSANRTFYNAHGDVFGWVCVGCSLLMIGRKLTAIRKSRAGPRLTNDG
jgi:apolipoprotein N-acyltransferase